MRNTPTPTYPPQRPFRPPAPPARLETQLVLGVVGLVAVGGLAVASRHLVKKGWRDIRRSQAEKGSLEEGDPALIAKQLHMAFENDTWFGWGTDEEAIKQLFQSLPSQRFYRDVQQRYRQMYGESLNEALEDELTSEELMEVLAIYHSKK